MLEAFLTIDKLAEAIKLLATNGITIRIEGLGGFSGFPKLVTAAAELPAAEQVPVAETPVAAPAVAPVEAKRGRKGKAEKQPEVVETPKAEVVEETVEEQEVEEAPVAEAAMDDLDLDLPVVEHPKATVGEVREALIKLREKHGDVIVAQVFQRCGCKNMRDLLPESYGMAVTYAKKALAEGRIQ